MMGTWLYIRTFVTIERYIHYFGGLFQQKHGQRVGAFSGHNICNTGVKNQEQSYCGS
jgi:hypothetical protein